jgi:predicted nucleic acid-binding protein
MKYVIDTSVGFKWAVSEIHSDKAVLLRDEFHNGIHELLAPDLFPTEIANALAVAEGRRASNQARPPCSLPTSSKVPPSSTRQIPLLPRAIDICLQSKQSVYDCLYVALAERETAQLVTADDKLVRNLQSQFPFIVPLASP